jgi:hypothetical protein
LKKLFLLLTIIITSFLLIGIGTQPTLASDSSQKSIPEWIKNNAGWWAEGKIYDGSFVSGIQWLISNDVITVSSTGQETKIAYEIPTWIKNNAGWWAEGKIPDSAFISGLEWLLQHGIIVINLPGDVDPYDLTFAPFIPNVKQDADLDYITTTFFHIFGDRNAIEIIDGMNSWTAIYLALNDDGMDEYNEVAIWNDPQKAVVVYPHFTSAAYHPSGFYDYYRGDCDECTTTKITIARLVFAASGNAFQALSLMGYDTTTDYIIDRNPSILEEYDKVIMLHNEYVTRTVFDAVTNHPKVIYLYPNAFYGEIEVDYESGLMTLIRGHGYPEPEISNGFDWEFDNTHPYEYDTECSHMEFYEIDNGWMANCYPEYVFTNSIQDTYDILKLIKEL